MFQVHIDATTAAPEIKKQEEEPDFFAEHTNDDNNGFGLAQDSNHNKSLPKPPQEVLPKVRLMLRWLFKLTSRVLTFRDLTLHFAFDSSLRRRQRLKRTSRPAAPV